MDLAAVQEFARTLTLFDIIAGAVILLLGVRCLMRGFVKEVFSLAGIIGAVIVSRMYNEQASAFFRPWVGTDLQARVVAYAAIGTGIIIAASVTSWLVYKAIKRSVLGVLDRIGGLCIGLLQGVVIVGIALLTAESLIGNLEKTFAAKSVLAPHLIHAIKFLSGIVFAKV